MDDLGQKLRNWRSRRAMLDSVEVFRVLSNDTLNEILEVKPRTKEELLAVKGFKEKKFQKYGVEILNIINGGSSESVGGMTGLFASQATPDKEQLSEQPGTNEKKTRVRRVSVTAEIMNMKGGVEELAKQTEERVFSVSDYLDLINVALTDFQAKVQGEVSSLDIRGNYLFFGLKDKRDGSTMSCFMWQSNYRMSGVKLEEGLEIIVYGHPNIYKAAGKISMQVETIEHVGEGALKKAYDELKAKLTKEGIFAVEKKRALPEYPERLGLITSKTGAVIHDFLNNLGKFGYSINFLDSRVEGQMAVKDLIDSIRSFRDKDIDVLVIIRGGGSLESLLAFNNEMLVREIAQFPKPVLVGIGHDKDVPLAALAADKAESTPTATAKQLNSTWEKALSRLQLMERDIFNFYGETLTSRIHFIDQASHRMTAALAEILHFFRELETHLKLNFTKIGFKIKNLDVFLKNQMSLIFSRFEKIKDETDSKVIQFAKLIEASNPERHLKLGYAIARINGKVLRSSRDAKQGTEIDIKLADGNIKTKVID